MRINLNHVTVTSSGSRPLTSNEVVVGHDRRVVVFGRRQRAISAPPSRRRRATGGRRRAEGGRGRGGGRVYGMRASLGRRFAVAIVVAIAFVASGGRRSGRRRIGGAVGSSSAVDTIAVRRSRRRARRTIRTVRNGRTGRHLEITSDGSQLSGGGFE